MFRQSLLERKSLLYVFVYHFHSFRPFFFLFLVASLARHTRTRKVRHKSWSVRKNYSYFLQTNVTVVLFVPSSINLTYFYEDITLVISL
jgi:hypothetical protein